MDHFTLPEFAWLENYYAAIEGKLPDLRRKYAGQAEALATLDMEQAEIDLYRSYSAWYGYEFYLLQKDAS